MDPSIHVTKPLRVLHVISNFGVGGAEVWILALLRYFKSHLTEAGQRVECDIFLTNGVRDQLDDQAEALGARLIYSRYSRGTLLPFVHTWRRALKTGGYTAIHDHQEFSAGWHFLFGKSLLPPVRIAHLHNPMTHQASYGSGFLRKKTISVGNHLIAKHATHILSTSRQLITEQGFDDLRAAASLPKITINCGFDPSRFAGNRQSAREALHCEFKIPSDARVLLFVGRLDSHSDESRNQKNPSFCLEVAKECACRDPSFICLIAGSGEKMMQILRHRVRTWGLENRILFLGSRADVPHLMLGADVLLFPSIAEGLGMVAVEAQAAGLPVIASDAVPRECSVVDNMVKFQPLSAGVGVWADVVLNTIYSPSPDHTAANLEVQSSPFSIAKSAGQLVEIYSGGLSSIRVDRQ